MAHTQVQRETENAIENLYRSELASLQLSNTKLLGKFEDLESRTCKLELAVNAAQVGTSDAQLQPDSAEPGDLGLVIGSFDSSEVRTGPPTWTTATKTVQFNRLHPTLPGVIVGFSKLDISSAHNMRVTTYASNILNNSFDINIDGSDGTLLHGVRCNWLKISAKNPGLQYGRYNTHDYAPWAKVGGQNQRSITFQQPYMSPPEVLVWLSAFDMDSSKSWRLGAYANDVTSGFKIHIDTWGDTVLRSAILSWVAYPKTAAGMFGGTFDTVAMRPHNSPQLYNSGYITFPTGSFSSPLRILVVISSIDIDRKTPLRLTVSTSTLSATGVLWHLNSWGDTLFYYARASYIAIE